MRSFLVVFLAVAAGLAHAAPPQQPAPSPRLRITLQQYHPDATQGPRRLSADERAVLRRQIAESAQRAQRR